MLKLKFHDVVGCCSYSLLHMKSLNAIKQTQESAFVSSEVVVIVKEKMARKPSVGRNKRQP